MSKRLQVLMDEQEWAELEAIAQRHGQTVSDWVRQALRAAWREESSGQGSRKLAAVRLAARHEFPTADIDQMLEEISRGYGGLPE